ncbi:MAG: hypothetical protein HYT87_12285 [Nitrospirae bacterium]|nr:hypothetical protein [Nitrospirota bacterium]
MAFHLADVNDLRLVLPRMAAPVSQAVEMPIRAVAGVKNSSPQSSAPRLETGEAADKPRRPVRVGLRSIFDMLAQDELHDLINIANAQFRNGNLASAANMIRRAHRLVNRPPEDQEESIQGLPSPYEDEEDAQSAPESSYLTREGANATVHSRLQTAAPFDFPEFDDAAKATLWRSTQEFMTVQPPSAGIQVSLYI